jgi:hypothetical protein
MTKVCVSRNLTITDGVLGLAPWSVPRIVVDVVAPSIGDGQIGATTSLPGKLMIDKQVSWTNDAPLPTPVLFRLQRGGREFSTSNPNAVQVRDRWTTRQGVGPQTPAVPDTTTVLQSQFGGALDLSSNTTATPIAGRLWQFIDAQITEDWLGPVEPGETLSVWYRCTAWTPPPWADNANNNAPFHDVYVRNARMQLVAMPVSDEAI